VTKIGDNIVRLESVESTSLYVRENRHLLADGTAVIANDQTGGRGRHDKTWISLPGKSLTFSFLLCQSAKDLPTPFLHLFPAVAVVQSLRKLNIHAHIKWPNDIYLNGKKIGGLLVQTFSQSDKIDVIIGIGLNVCEDAFDFSELREHAGSIWSLAGLKIEIEALFQAILQELNLIYEKYHHPSQWEKLQTLWCDLCAHLNEKITIFQDDKTVQGTFVGLDENGFARVQTGSEQIVIQDYEYVSLRAEHDTRN
jgi:BirA family biotin operon repressor/biotin-[acetyl-CoA-carboxylase] ligase